MTNNQVNIIIVEDEILLAQDIAIRLSVHYHILGIAASAAEALVLLDEHLHTIDILLLDIKLQGNIDGIDLAQIINQKYQLPFIFLTSHADKSLVARAKSVKPAAYMLKPFHDRELNIAIEMALVNFESQHHATDEQPTYEKEENPVLQISDRLFLKKDHHFERVAIKDICLLEADGNYTTIYTQNDKYIYTTLLRKMEEKLPPHQFLRVHRSYIVQIEAVKGFEGNTLFVHDKKIPVSKSCRESVFQFFNPF